MSKYLFSCLYPGKFNVYLRQSIHFSISGCSENCTPILAQNNLEITAMHSAKFLKKSKVRLDLIYSLHLLSHVQVSAT